MGNYLIHLCGFAGINSTLCTSTRSDEGSARYRQCGRVPLGLMIPCRQNFQRVKSILMLAILAL